MIRTTKAIIASSLSVPFDDPDEGRLNATLEWYLRATVRSVIDMAAASRSTDTNATETYQQPGRHVGILLRAQGAYNASQSAKDALHRAGVIFGNLLQPMRRAVTEER